MQLIMTMMIMHLSLLPVHSIPGHMIDASDFICNFFVHIFQNSPDIYSTYVNCGGSTQYTVSCTVLKEGKLIELSLDDLLPDFDV